MRNGFLSGALGLTLLLAPAAFAQSSKPSPTEPATKASTKPRAEKGTSCGMSADMCEAIAFQRAKDEADARQARKEARHPSVTYNNNSNADRSADRENPNRVIDPGPGSVKKDK